MGQRETGTPVDECRQTWMLASPPERIVQGSVAVVLAAALALGVFLEPSPTGMGTHSGLGLPPCGLLVMTGKPCPTCGVTTSFVLAAHGRFYESLVNQPFGLAVFLALVGWLLFSVVTLVTRRSWIPLLSAYNMGAVAVAVVVLLLACWAYKWASV